MNDDFFNWMNVPKFVKQIKYFHYDFEEGFAYVTENSGYHYILHCDSYLETLCTVYDAYLPYDKITEVLKEQLVDLIRGQK